MIGESEARYRAKSHGDMQVDAVDVVELFDRINELQAQPRTPQTITLSNGEVVTDTVLIPVPLVAPFETKVDTPQAVQEVWDAFVKPHQDSGELQSVEMRALMAILRAVYAGLEVRK